ENPARTLRYYFEESQINKVNTSNWDNVVFIDEIWLNANHTVSRTWTDDTAASTSKVPSGKVARLNICHATSASQGFIPDCLLAFASKTTTTKPSKLRYVIYELALEHGHKVIRLPPYHCQYNAIELIWAQIKGHAARNNTEPPFSTAKMMSLLQTACAEVTTEDEKNRRENKEIILQDFEGDMRID
ncbi:Uncharacterized protein OBRU01_13237, partial [Operophtera brumata]